MKKTVELKFYDLTGKLACIYDVRPSTPVKELWAVYKIQVELCHNIPSLGLCDILDQLFSKGGKDNE